MNLSDRDSSVLLYYLAIKFLFTVNSAIMTTGYKDSGSLIPWYKGVPQEM